MPGFRFLILLAAANSDPPLQKGEGLGERSPVYTTDEKRHDHLSLHLRYE